MSRLFRWIRAISRDARPDLSRQLDLHIEPLDERILLATFTVTNVNDALVFGANQAPGTLRQALFDANQNPGADTIEFDLEAPGFLALEHGELVIQDPVTINGPGENLLTISGEHSSRVFAVPYYAGVSEAEINNLTMANGSAFSRGGAIYAFSSLTLREVTITNSYASTRGGAVGVFTLSGGSSSITNSTIVNNSAQFGGGGVFSQSDPDTTVEIRDTLIAANHAGLYGGGVHALGGITIANSLVTGNSATTEGGGLYLYSNTASLQVLESSIIGNSAVTGGGIYSVVRSDGTLLVEDSLVSGNTADVGGGMMSYSRSTNPTVRRTTIAANAADQGGGIGSDARDGQLAIVDSLISGNSATSGGGSYTRGGLRLEGTSVQGNHATREAGGMDIYSDAADVELFRSSIVGNSADASGGGLFADMEGARLLVVESLVADNYASGGGGGMLLSLYANTSQIVRSTISGNTADNDGGGVFAISRLGRIVIDYSTISGNSSGDNGGGAYFYNPNIQAFDVTIRSSTISGNSAANDGGGLHSLSNEVSLTTVTHSTIYRNYAADDAGGMEVNLATEIKHSIVAANIAGNTASPDLDGTIEMLTVDYSLVGVDPGLSGGSGNLVGSQANRLDPRLMELNHNGGPTQTHALLDDSPALDAGDPSFTAGPDFDQRGAGFDRVAGDAIDIGAFERNSSLEWVVADRRADTRFRHDDDGSLLEANALDPANRNVTGVAVAESTTWTIDRNRDVFVYGESGEVLGRWRPSDVRRPEGIATDGTHLWIVDRTTDRVYFYANGAQLRSGDVTATSSFELDDANGQAFGITVGLENGQQKLWVVDDRGSTEQVFRYRLDGVLEGRWEFDTDENSQPRGIAVDGASASDVWIVDRRSDRVTRFDAAASTTTGFEAGDERFALAEAAIDPQGLAIPTSPPTLQPNATLPGQPASSFGTADSDSADATAGLRLRFAGSLSPAPFSLSIFHRDAMQDREANN